MSEEKSFWSLFGHVPGEAPKGPSFLKLFGDPNPKAPEDDPEYPCAIRFREDAVFWALRNTPIREAVKHFLICGAVGAGKTTAIELFLQSIAPRFRPGREHPEQLIIFDAKRDILPTLAALGYTDEDENVWILNPFDNRCAVWSLAEAAASPAMARYIATLLVPEEKRSTSPFFFTAARDLIVYVMWGLNVRAPKRWSFRDLLCALDSEKHIRGITAYHPRARRLADSILKDDKHAFGVLSTLTTKLGRFEEVAGLWHGAGSARRFSVPEFLKNPGVLVLGYDPALNESLWPINAILLKALTDEILRGPNKPEPRHWFVFDEFRAMQNVDCMHDLLNRGRSKGASVLIALQSIAGLIDVYGQHRATDLLSACANKTFLRLGDPDTAAWAERFFGQIRRSETVVSESWGGKGGFSSSVQRSLVDRPMLLASTFLNLPFTGPGRPYQAINDVPWLGCTTLNDWSFDVLHSWRVPPAKVDPFCPWADEAVQTMEEWSDAEEAFYCPEPPPEPKKEKKKNAPKKRARKKEPLPSPPQDNASDLPGLS